MKITRASLILTVTAMIAVLTMSSCSKKVSTTGIEGTQKPEVAVVPQETPHPVYETVAEPPVPQPDISQGHISTGVREGAKSSGAAAKGITDVYFDFDRYIIRDDAREGLGHNSDYLRGKSFKRLVIEGHADERGTSDYNLALGERRAQSVMKYLTTMGIASSKVSVVTFGREKPFCTEHNEDCWQQNRRAHFVLSE